MNNSYLGETHMGSVNHAAVLANLARKKARITEKRDLLNTKLARVDADEARVRDARKAVGSTPAAAPAKKRAAKKSSR
jgi:hypothetical protein